MANAQEFLGDIQIYGDVVAEKLKIAQTAVLPTNTSIGAVSAAQIGFLSGVTSSVQEQLTVEQTAREAADNTLTANKVSIAFTDSNGAQNYVGKNVGSMSLNSGTHMFTNCTGAVNLIGNTAKIYAVNSPNLTITGKTGANWRNISVDGRSEFVALNTLVVLTGAQQEILPQILFPGDFITIAFESTAYTQSSSQLSTFAYGQGSTVVRIGYSDNIVPTSNDQYYIQLSIFDFISSRGTFDYNGNRRQNLFSIKNITIWRDNQ